MTMQRVLVVEDDDVMRSVITLALRAHGYEVTPVGTGGDAVSEVRRRPPDAVILDLGLPDMDGFEVTTQVRKNYGLPIIVLSARGGEQDQIRALDGGANDYVTKPFREGELMARVRAALRTPGSAKEPRELHVGDLCLDIPQRRAFVGSREVVLTRTEFDLVLLMARHADQVVTHGQLLREVWGPQHEDKVQYLRVYMKQLREKLEKDPTKPQRIVTALGVGYRLIATPES